jgi:hypothetical protein
MFKILTRVNCLPIILPLCLLGCGRAASREPEIGAKKVADMLHAVLEADRAAYTTHVVNRLIQEQQLHTLDPTTKQPRPLTASEQWKTEPGTLPLPAQMFRIGAETVAKKNLGFSYALLSKWPLNPQNKAKTKLEQAGISAALQQPKVPFYGSEQLGTVEYFTAVYADVAVAPACVDCHNKHRDAPRTDFKVGDVMGAVVIRVPVGGS